MGFSWTPITVGTLDKAVHKNQIKTNVDVVYSDLELSQYNWQYLPVSIGDEIDDAVYQEMRDAIDYADDQNYCRNHDASYNGVDQAVAKSGDDATAYTGADSPHRITVYGSQDSGMDSTHDVGVDGDYDSGVQGTYNSGVDVSHDTTVYYDYDDGVLFWHEATVHSDHKFSYWSSVNGSYNSGFG